jgi:hypothetical protein
MIALLLACTGDPAPAPDPAAESPPEPTPMLLPGPPPVGGPDGMTRFEPLQGRWNSVEDPRAQVLILKSLWMEGYDGVQQSQIALEWADGCRADGGRPSPTGTTLNLLSEPPRCMQVVAVSADSLELVELPEGRHLRFVRSSGGL